MKLHYTTLNKFNELFYKDILTPAHLVEQERHFKKLDEPRGGIIENFWGYIYSKADEKYLLSSQDFKNIKDSVGLKPKMTQKVAYRDEVYHLITKVAPINFKKEDRVTFKECINRLNSFERSDERQGKLLWIVMIAAYFGRFNIRLSSEPGFGKDSSIEVLKSLFGKSSSVVSPTVAKLERLANTEQLIAINEVNDLALADFRNIEQFLLSNGDLKNEVTKRSRAFDNVGEVIDISKLSLALFYNDVDCYPLDRDYFDMLSKAAVRDRFIAMRFTGRITEDFSKVNEVNVEQFVANNMEWYKDLIYSLEYHVTRVDDAWKIKGFNITPTSNHSSRQVGHLKVLYKFLALYCDDEEEFLDLKQGFETAIKEYEAMIKYLSLSVENGDWLNRRSNKFMDDVYPKMQGGQETLK